MLRTLSIIVTSVLLLFQLSFAQAESLRVSKEWLNDHLQDKNLVILDARAVSDYEIDHISGALSFPDALTYQQKSKGGNIVEPDVMQSLLQQRGIDKNNLVVVYDGGQIVDSARLFWALEVYGLNVRILSPGFDDWLKSGFPVSSTVPQVKPSQYVASINHHRIASKFSTQLATKNPNQVVMDARDADSYNGKKSSAKRFGHIPTAVNIPASHNVKVDEGVTALRDIGELKNIYSSLPKDGKIVIYCEIGRVSAANYFVLRELGYDVSNYDSSWREWGNDFSLPIEK